MIVNLRQFLLTDRPGRLRSIRLRKSDGARGILETVRLIRRMVDICRSLPSIRSLAAPVIAALPDRRGGPAADVDAIFRYLKSRARYVGDCVDVEVLQTPAYTLRKGGGDCDDLTILGGSFLEAVGVPVRFRIAGRGVEWKHIYLLTKNGYAWRPFDLTLDRPGVENSKKYDTFKDI